MFPHGKYVSGNDAQKMSVLLFKLCMHLVFRADINTELDTSIDFFVQY